MKAIVNVTIANLHAEPNINAELVDEVLFGMTVSIIEECGNEWAKVQTFYGYEGYCLKQQFVIGDEQTSAWQKSAQYVVAQSLADVLREPKIQASKIVTMTKGAFVQVIPQHDLEKEWTKVSVPSGEIGYVRTGWLQQKVVKQPDEAIFRQQVVETALQYLHTPYRWGGKSHLGIDCSGLCSMAYMLHGVLIYRDAKIMDGYPLKEISREQLKRGDLIFFPGHVAMYIGDDKYIHSSLANNEVNVNSLNNQDALYHEGLANSITAFGSIFN